MRSLRKGKVAIWKNLGMISLSYSTNIGNSIESISSTATLEILVNKAIQYPDKTIQSHHLTIIKHNRIIQSHQVMITNHIKVRKTNLS